MNGERACTPPTAERPKSLSKGCEEPLMHMGTGEIVASPAKSLLTISERRARSKSLFLGRPGLSQADD
jgi:hypothetical protein